LKVGILTFHSTPNYGATLQCYALKGFLVGRGVDVEIINYVPVPASLAYLRLLSVGRERGLANVRRVHAFRRFVKQRLKLSGAPMVKREQLARLGKRYDVAFTGSDEVWKVNAMRPFDPSFYLDFCDPGVTRICSYAASASSLTDLRRFPAVGPLLARFSGLSVRDASTAAMVKDLSGREPQLVLDPTLLYEGWAAEDLKPLHERPYIAVYAWMNRDRMAPIREFAEANGLDVVCVGCRHPDADRNYLGAGPVEWLRLIKHSALVVTNFFHGVVFALIFGRPLFTYVDQNKRLKLSSALALANLADRLYASPTDLPKVGFEGCRYDANDVHEHFRAARVESVRYMDDQLGEAASGAGR
jgi:hypothetical protein